jgi:hypothetical protein
LKREPRTEVAMLPHATAAKITAALDAELAAAGVGS